MFTAPMQLHFVMRQAQKRSDFAALMVWVGSQAGLWQVVKAYTSKFDPALYRALVASRKTHKSREETGMLQIIDSYQKGNADQHLDQLQHVLECFSNQGGPLMHKLMYRAVADQRRLVALQEHLEAQFKLKSGVLQYRSVNDTVHMLVQMQQFDLAVKMKQDFHMTDDQYCWVKLSALAAGLLWNHMEALWNAGARSDPEPFVLVCLEQNAYVEAQKYVRFVKIQDRFELAMRCKDYQLAAETAVQLRNRIMLNEVQEKCRGDEVIQGYIRAHVS